MPLLLPERLPLPNLRFYSCGSVLALSACMYFATQTIREPDWMVAAAGGTSDRFSARTAAPDLNQTNSSSSDGRSVGQYMSDVFTVMVREPVCVWTMINMAFCCLILIGGAIQKLVFGDLRVSEKQHLKDKFWNFVFYKFIFVFGIINVQYIDEVLLWCSWFALLGFLHLLSQLSKDRFEYLSFSPMTPVWSHVKLLVLLSVIFALSGFMLLVCVFVGFFGGFNTFAFMSAEVVLLSIRTLHVIIRYILHLYDMRQDGDNNHTGVSNNNTSSTSITNSTTSSTSSIINSTSNNNNNNNQNDENNKVWEKRGPIAYYIELTFELTALIIDFIHHLHMLLWSNIFLSMASLVICMQLRYLFHEIQRRYKKHRNYLWVRNHLEQNYPMATAAELSENSDNCAICWEKMESARKLPCVHLFHNTCLLSWLEQDTSCPTCRLALNIQNPLAVRAEPVELQTDVPQAPRRQLNHFFHFDGSRYVSWLPSFSVEVTHAQLVRNDNAPASNSQLDAMARQVQQLFPHIPMSTIIDDLRVTRSVEITIENVLDGRLIVPAMYREPEPLVQPTIIINPRSISLLNNNNSFNNQDISRRNWDNLSSTSVAASSSSSSSLSTTTTYIEPLFEDNNTSNYLGSRFSKSSAEREKILHRRKENLIQKARKRYIERQKVAATTFCHRQSSSSSSLLDDNDDNKCQS